MYTGGVGLVCKCTGCGTLEGSVQYGGIRCERAYSMGECTLGVQNFFNYH